MASKQLKQLEIEKSTLLEDIKREYEEEPDQELKEFLLSNLQAAAVFFSVDTKSKGNGYQRHTSKFEDIKVASGYLTTLTQSSQKIQPTEGLKEEPKKTKGLFDDHISRTQVAVKKKGRQTWGLIDVNSLVKKNNTIKTEINLQNGNGKVAPLDKEDILLYGFDPFEDLKVVRCKKCKKVVTIDAFLSHNEYCKALSADRHWNMYISSTNKQDNKSNMDISYSNEVNKSKLKKRKSPPESIEKVSNKKQVVAPNEVRHVAQPDRAPSNVMTIERILQSFTDEITPEHYRQVCHILWSSRSGGKYVVSNQYAYQIRLIAKSLSNQRMSLLTVKPGTNTPNLKRFSSSPRKIHYDVVHPSQPHIFALPHNEFKNRLLSQQAQAYQRSRMMNQQQNPPPQADANPETSMR